MTNELTMSNIVAPYENEGMMLESLNVLRANKREVIKRIQEDADTINEQTYRAKKLNAFDKEDALLKELADKIADEIATRTHSKELFVEIAADRNEIKDAIKERAEKIRTLKEQFDPPIPRHTYAFLIETTDANLKKIMTVLNKNGDKYRFGTPQSDKAIDELENWFESNI